jgi:dienelactone hydrolase
MNWPAILFFALLVLAPTGVWAELPCDLAARYEAKDTLAIGEESSPDARACLAGLDWKPEAFAVRCEEPGELAGDVVVRFPSPVPVGDAVNDRVALEWYIARDKDWRPMKAPAVIVVHESGSGMTVGRLFARGLRALGLHTFLIHLPNYGARRGAKGDPTAADLVTMIRQAVADVRRARDAAAALPWVDSSRIALQGTSLGGFVAATAAGLDDGFDGVFIVLAGGGLYDLIQHGAKDAAKVRAKLAEGGLTGEKLKRLVYAIEPLRLAHRLDPRRTWLYSGKWDKVVPLENAVALAKAAGLDARHHVQFYANHYSGIVYLPLIFDDIRRHIDRPREEE